METRIIGPIWFGKRDVEDDTLELSDFFHYRQQEGRKGKEPEK